MGQHIHALCLPATEAACCRPASPASRAVRVENAARDSVPETSGTGCRN
ncbi:hypothetical protein [Streptomyces nigrescens]